MSNAAQSWAWQQEGLLSSDKIVLVALADNAWEDGSNAYPSVALLTRKTGLCRRTVQTALRRLTEAGRIVEQASAMPMKGMPTTYRLIMTPRAESAPPRAPDAQGPRATTAQDPAHLTTYPRAAAAPEPSTNPTNPEELPLTPSERTTTETFHPDVALLADARQKYPGVDFTTETEAWRDYHLERATKIRDFRASWRRWMRQQSKWDRNRSRPKTAQTGYTDADRDRPAQTMTGDEWRQGA